VTGSVFLPAAILEKYLDKVDAAAPQMLGKYKILSAMTGLSLKRANIPCGNDIRSARSERESARGGTLPGAIQATDLTSGAAVRT
jgi:hypothetical protein